MSNCLLPEGWVSGNVLATNLSKVLLSYRSWVTVSLFIIMRQILVQEWLWSFCSWILSLPSVLLPWIARSNRGNRIDRCYSLQHSYRSSNRFRMSGFWSRPALTHSVAKLKKLDKLCSATEASEPLSRESWSRSIFRSRRLKICVNISRDTLPGQLSSVWAYVIYYLI